MLEGIRLGKIGRFGFKRGARKVARAAQQAETSIKETQEFINKEAWPELKEKLGVLSEVSGTVTKSLAKLDEFLDLAGEVLSLHTNALGLVLMLLAGLVCRLAINSIPREWSVCSSLQRSIFYAIFISCISLAVYFIFEILFELSMLERQDAYSSNTIWLLLFAIPLLEAVFQILWYLVKGLLGMLGGVVCWCSRRLTFAVLCAAVAVSVAVYVQVVGDGTAGEE